MTYAFDDAPRAAVRDFRTSSVKKNSVLNPLARIRYQLLGGLILAVLMPALLRSQFEAGSVHASLQNSALATAIAVVFGTYIYRRLLVFPGVNALSFILPSFIAVYGVTMAGFLLFRVDYSRFQLLASFLVAVPWFSFASIVERRCKRPLFSILPAGNAEALTTLEQADWRVLTDPVKIPRDTSGVVADLRADLPPAWEKMLATSALSGIPVYHSKLVAELLTGRVEIEHLSENSLGSLLPSSIYLRCRRMLDILGIVTTAPFTLFIGLVAASLIKLEDRGPVFFTQPRTGLGGRIFTIIKFRTMQTGLEGRPYTVDDDPRITRIGKVLRRYRIDELPQIINVLRGEMSLIGPRPESLALSARYESRIPFYSYRHIVRPGITGWAQVQQGHVSEVDAVAGKLHYDFFYIKYFSPWLDLLIAARTIRTVLTGFGAR